MVSFGCYKFVLVDPVQEAEARHDWMLFSNEAGAAMTKRPNPNWRNGLLAKIHIAKKQMPEMDDETYRAILHKRYGKTSAGKLTKRELADFVNYLEAKGAEFTNSGTRTKTPRKDFYEIPDGTSFARQKRWIAAMWNALDWKMSGLDTRCASQFGVDRFVWLNDQRQLQTLAKDLIGRCRAKGIDPDDAQPAQ